MKYNKFYWKQLTVTELRNILFDTKQLDTRRNSAREELKYRTINSNIYELFGRNA